MRSNKTKNVTNDKRVSHIHINIRTNKPENSYASGMKIFASKSLLYTVYFLPLVLTTPSNL